MFGLTRLYQSWQPCHQMQFDLLDYQAHRPMLVLLVIDFSSSCYDCSEKGRHTDLRERRMMNTTYISHTSMVFNRVRPEFLPSHSMSTSCKSYRVGLIEPRT